VDSERRALPVLIHDYLQKVIRKAKGIVMKKLGRLLIFIGLLTGVAALHAQETQVTGQVRDVSQAAIAGAKVSITRTETGDRREVTTGGEGYYTFPLLLPGHYGLKVEKEGFETQNQTGIVVETGNTSSVNVTLKVGSSTQTVEVDATVPLLQTETSAVAQVVENASITNLPLVDRRSAQLQRLNGFAVQTNSGASASFAVAGGRANNADYLIDGGTAQNLLIGVPTLVFDPPVESVQEFNVAISNYSAELGRSGGAVVQMTTKSGTNSFHGSAYEYLRNTVLQQQPEFATTKPDLHYNLFGASLGGPIKKDKTQFFFNYEGRRTILATPVSLPVPNAQTLTGNFNGIIDPKTGVQVVVKDPATGLPFANNQIPTASQDPVGLSLAAFYPQVNAGTSPTGQFVANDPATTVVDAYVARVDHVFGQKDRIFGRFLAQTDHTLTAAVFPVPASDPLGNLVHDYYYNVSGNWFHNFNPNTINELRLTYTRRQYLYYSAGANSTVASSIGLNTFDPNYFPTVTFAQGALEPLGNTTQQERLQTPVNSNAYVDNVSWVHGKHQFKFGGEWRTSNNTDRFRPFGGGLFAFNNFGTSSNTAVGSLANLLLGNVNTATINEFYTIHSVASAYGAFAQDDWRVTPRLTLNLGLRWDVDSPRKTDPNAQNLFDPTAINPVSNTPGVVTFSGIGGISAYAHHWDLNNFGPRLGFAWSPREKWVVRGGASVLFTPEYDSATPTVANLGYGTTGTSSPSVYNATTGIYAPSFELKSMPVFWVSPTTADLTPSFGAAAPGPTAPYYTGAYAPHTVVQYFSNNHVNGYIYQASFGIQRELANNLLLDVGYVGTFGHSLPVTDNAGGQYSINQVPDADLPLINPALGGSPALAQSLRPYPQFANVQILDPNIGQSKYNGVNVGIQKRYSQGLQFQANYTWSKNEDNADGRNELAAYPGNNSYTDYYNPQSRWGLSGSDVRHRVIVSTLYDLPFGRGKKFSTDSRLLDEVVGGWSIGAIAELHTGTALSVLDAVNNTSSFSDGVRPNLIGNPVLSSAKQSSGAWFNTAAFQQNAPYTFGDAPRTFGSGPGTAQVDASLLKNFPIHESTALQFRAEALNVLNHPNWANPNTLFGSPIFGKVTGLQPGNQSRIIQVALHLTF
jgi:Carboxypeptidase regulatory-like domain/TonB dependent receptor-like, beta-barrel